jgi:hypothetical protein
MLQTMQRVVFTFEPNMLGGWTMFGSKDEKQRRLELEWKVICEQGPISVPEIARQLGLLPSTVYKDLPHLRDIAEDELGRLSIVEWRRRS